MNTRWIVLLITLLAAGPAAAGVVYEIEVTDHETSPARVESTEVSVEGRLLKMSIAAGQHGGRGDMIFRGDRREMVVVDHDERSYFTMDQETMEKMAAQVSDAMRQMQEALKGVPEGQREMVERMMKERMPQQAAPARPETELHNTGERATHHGYPCVRYDVLLNGQKVRELWVTEWSGVEGGAEVHEVFREMSEFFQEMMEKFSDATGMPGMGADSFVEELTRINGFPVVTREFDNGSLTSESVLRSSRRQTLDPADFEPPAGYKRRQMFAP